MAVPFPLFFPLDAPASPRLLGLLLGVAASGVDRACGAIFLGSVFWSLGCVSRIVSQKSANPFCQTSLSPVYCFHFVPQGLYFTSGISHRVIFASYNPCVYILGVFPVRVSTSDDLGKECHWRAWGVFREPTRMSCPRPYFMCPEVV